MIAVSFERIQRGEAIAVDELVADRDALAAAILKSGGLCDHYQRVRNGQAQPDFEHYHAVLAWGLQARVTAQPDSLLNI